MGLFSGFNFPWTDLHTLNLDWLLRSVKSLLDRYNPVAKSEDMTQPVGVDGDGKLFTAPGDPTHADGTNYGTVNPVSTTSDMTQPVGVDASGKLFTAPGEGSADPPHADGTNYGTVNPVSTTSDMTQPVGVDESGKLFTKPGGGGSSYIIEKLWERPDSVHVQDNYEVQNLSSATLANYDVIAIDIFIQSYYGAKQRFYYTNAFINNDNTYLTVPCAVNIFGALQTGCRIIAIQPSGSIYINAVRYGTTTNSGACIIDAIYGIKKEEA